MILTSLITFFGGSAFRMVWGEVSSFFTKRQDHSFEIERIKLQGEQAAAAHQRSQDAIRLQAELGIKTIAAQSEADETRIAGEGWYGAVRDAIKPTGIYIVDLWNGVIRPLAATIAILLWVGALFSQSFIMSDWDKELCGAILGFFLADRALTKRGK